MEPPVLVRSYLPLAPDHTSLSPYLECECDGDGSALAGEVGLHAEHGLDGARTGLVVRVVGVRHPAAAAVEHKRLRAYRRATVR